jgi:hypothetical protein
MSKVKLNSETFYNLITLLTSNEEDRELGYETVRNMNISALHYFLIVKHLSGSDRSIFLKNVKSPHLNTETIDDESLTWPNLLHSIKKFNLSVEDWEKKVIQDSVKEHLFGYIKVGSWKTVVKDINLQIEWT